MNRTITAAFLGCMLTVAAVAPAFAESNDDTRPVPVVADGAAAPAKTGASTAKGGGGNAVTNGVTKAASFVTGMLIGTPVAFVRASKREYINATKDITGESSNPIFWGAASTLGLPAGVLSGALYGPFYGIRNSAKNAGDEPFSKDSMSLGDSL